MINNKLLQEATDRLVSNFHPQMIFLFGSQARGTADSRSDVDLLVICNFTGKRRTLTVSMDRALKGLGFARDIIVLRPEEFERDRDIPGTVAQPAYKEGRILYERH
jgi:predicted nucleotidyltransferase